MKVGEVKFKSVGNNESKTKLFVSDRFQIYCNSALIAFLFSHNVALDSGHMHEFLLSRIQNYSTRLQYITDFTLL